MQVNMHEAKTHLSRLVERAAAGEEIILAKAGRPVAKLVKLAKDEQTPRRREPPPEWKGQFWMADDFDETDPELIAAFYGELDEDKPDGPA